ncbi:MAG: double-strand break repair helicase AddA [Candidatus Puniceispirillaceae bacterium]
MTSPSSRHNRLYTIPAGVAFATSLAAGIIRLADGPQLLARATVLVPSRRAAQSLRAAFLEVLGEDAALLPRIDPIGDVEDDTADMLDFSVDAPALPQAMDPLRRQLWLARLLEGFRLGDVAPTPPQAMRLAESLARLLDSLGNADATPEMLRDLLPDRFSRHWQDILKLLAILIDRWPAILEEQGVIDAADRRNRLVRLRCDVWRQKQPRDLVIVAGSTGTFAATRELIACVADLPNGHVVLPGLDRDAGDHWDLVRAESGHPQHQLSVLLDSLEVDPQAVCDWPDLRGQHPASAHRRSLMREVFKPAALTGDWRQLGRTHPDLGRDALSGLALVDCETRTEEAALIALAMREVLEVPHRTAALVTPDRQLAEAVIAALRRWRIEVDDSAGRPLGQCGVGGFLQSLVTMLAEDFTPVPTLAFLKHPLASGGLAPARFRSQVRKIEMSVLRGYRPAPGLDGIRNGLAGDDELASFFEQAIAGPLASLVAAWQSPVPTLASLAVALGDAAERMAARSCDDSGAADAADGALHLWANEDGEAAATLLASLAEQGEGFATDTGSFPHIMAQLLSGRTVRRSWQTHPRLSILGPVEARMQSADRLILGGFNEGNWPPRPEIDPWTNAEMRRAAGLQPHNWRTGLSAHDVWMAICAPEVIVTRALRDGDAATTASRWRQRFDAVTQALSIGKAVDRGQRWRDAMTAMTPVPVMVPVARPRPAPPVTARPRRFSATEIDDWIADPYSLYAKRVLELYPQDDLDRPIDAALRGNLVHDALAAFLKTYPAGDLPQDSLAQLRAMARRLFEPYWRNPTVRHFWWPAFETLSAWFIETEAGRRGTIRDSHAEIKGRIGIGAPCGPVTFTARADRIDLMKGGGLAILDYKTGKAPKKSDVAKRRRTQLLVEAVIAAKGGFEGVNSDVVAAMEYWRLTGKSGEPGQRVDVRPDSWDAEKDFQMLAKLAADFDDPATVYASRPDPAIGPAFPLYDHLARVDEWRLAEHATGAGVPMAAGADRTSAHAPGFDPAVAADASGKQAVASDPDTSVFVSANAGTGKTKLLTDRVLRLMLRGAAPDSILCVTYTRAAAAEMRNRISGKLAKWTVASSEALLDDLRGMGISVPTQDMLARARSLFAEILDNDDGPRVETVHSFCQSVLRRFPIEAGIVPQAELADAFEQARLKSEARDNLLRGADPQLAEMIGRLAAQTSEGNAETLLDELLAKEARLAASDIEARLQTHFAEERGIDPALDLDRVIDALVTGLDIEGLRATAAALASSGVSGHQKRAAIMTAWLGEDDAGRRTHIDRLIAALFGGNGPLSERRLSNSDIRKTFPRAVEVQQAAQQALSDLIAARAAQRCRDLTTALYGFGRRFQSEYETLKTRRGLLDYDDLIRLTNAMLAKGDAAQWVAWKLDNGVHHLLLDEAQDTSPAQWQLLRRLGDEFFEAASQASGETGPRTLFVVGDFKQSIYSFQGADPVVMGRNRLELHERAGMMASPWREVSLDVSFRSARPVLDLVNLAIPDLGGITDPRMPGFQAHRSARRDAGGFVEVWPVVAEDEAPVEPPAFAPPEIQEPRDAAAQSASRLAERLAGWIGRRKLPSGQLMRAGDIMVLLRSRGRYHRLLLAALQQAGIPVAGADRMKLEDQIEIQDLLALGDVTLLPDDDLQLAAVLKSPLIGMSEETLFTLAHDRGGRSLHACLMAHAGGDSELGRIADRMAHFRDLAEGQSVFAFYSSVLIETRQDFRRRLGAAVDETLDHFLTLAQEFGTAGGVSLTHFLAQLRGSGGEVRRDMDSDGIDQVRVMTIHGAKGLEAPVVVLPDMLKPVSRVPEQLVRDPDSGFVYWAPGDVRPDFVSAARDQARLREDEEENRLLYVALTRARDGIVIGGWQAKHRRRLEESHYERLHAAVSAMDGVEHGADGALHLETEGAAPVIDSGLSVPPSVEEHMPVPDWLFVDAPAEPRPSRPLRPSQPDGRTQTIRAPGSRLAASVALARGRLAHRLFEVLPMIEDARRDAVRDAMLAAQVDVPGEEATRLAAEVEAVMSLAELAPVFGPHALAEISVSGVVDGIGVAGQIDRLHVDEERVLLADFKTGPRPPRTPVEYVRQMALYAALLEQIYPGRKLVTWLVWPEAGAIEESGAAARAAALAPSSSA